MTRLSKVNDNLKGYLLQSGFLAHLSLQFKICFQKLLAIQDQMCVTVTLLPLFVSFTD